MRLLKLFTVIIFITGCSQRLSSAEQQQYQNNIIKVQNSVSDWIKKNALYPDSYEQVEFSEYSESYSKNKNGRIPDSENYVIRHTHKILDKDSILTSFSGYFLLEYDYSVNIIETERSNSIGGAFPPRTQVWTDRFGHPLNQQDSLELKEIQKKQTSKIINELKEGLNNGTIYPDSSGNDIDIRNFIDSLEKNK